MTTPRTRRATDLDGSFRERWSPAIVGSAAVHALALLIWGLSYDPQPDVPEPATRRAIRAIGLPPARPAPTPALTPKPAPTPEPEPAPTPEFEPEPEPEPAASTGPPPPPAACEGCALMPDSLGVPKDATRSKAKSIPWGVPGGVPGGVVGGVPGGVVGGVLGGNPSALGPMSAGVLQKPAAPEPLAVVMQRALYTPPPDPKLLAKTKTGMFSRHDGVNRTAFCIDEHGKTVAVRTTQRFGDPQVDQICLDAVKQWRFKAMKLDGKATRVCSVAVFAITFE